jgi:hypothetical protein
MKERDKRKRERRPTTREEKRQRGQQAVDRQGSGYVVGSTDPSLRRQTVEREVEKHMSKLSPTSGHSLASHPSSSSSTSHGKDNGKGKEKEKQKKEPTPSVDSHREHHHHHHHHHKRDNEGNGSSSHHKHKSHH